MEIIKPTNFRRNLFSFLDSVTNNNETIIVPTKDGNVGIVNYDYLKSLEETCFLMSIPNMTESIKSGMETSIDECRLFDWRKELK